MRELVKPEKIKIEEETLSQRYGKFIVEPLEKGFGITLGNSLRRILLSSIPGAAVTSIRIDGVTHEFATLPGVKEDVLQIIQNLKKLKVRLYTDQEKEVLLEERGPLEVKASHIKVDNEVEVMNPDLHIATLNDGKTRLSMQINLAWGRGYVEATENKREDQPVGTIPLDSIFTPVIKVKYEVHPARIGRKTSYDSLVMEIFTDGTIRPDEALNQAAKVLQEFAGLFILEQTEEEKKERFKEEFLKKEIEEVGLPTLALNALKSAGITKVEDAIKKAPKELLMIHNFGEKSLERLKRKLAEYNLDLKGSKNEAQKEGEETIPN